MAIEWIGPLAVGILAGIVDLFFMVKDETGDAKKVIGHGFAAFIPLIIFSFITFNLSLVTSRLPLHGFYTNEYFLTGVLVLVLAIIIHAKSSVFGKGPGSHETWLHTLLVAAIVAAGPTVWMYVKPMIIKPPAPVK